MIKKLSTISIILVSYLLFLPQSASAHLFGQPPFFKIDNVYSNFYHVPLTSLYNFGLPQDGAPREYLVGEPITFAFDINRLPAPPDVVKKTKFTWDFGDGTKGEGLSNTHTYKKMGSYIVQINADDGTTPTPQLLESVLLNILPDKNYPLPKAVITVNGVESKDPLVDIPHFPLTSQLRFDASYSKDEKASITSYLWDFGDQKSSSKKEDTHSYTKDTSQIFIVLRVTDSNGFIADDFMEVKNGTPDHSPTASTLPKQSDNKRQNSPNFLIIGLLFLGGLALMVRLFARGRGRGMRQ